MQVQCKRCGAKIPAYYASRGLCDDCKWNTWILEILSKAVDDVRKSAAYPWCLQGTKFQRGKGYATWTTVQQSMRIWQEIPTGRWLLGTS